MTLANKFLTITRFSYVKKYLLHKLVCNLDPTNALYNHAYWPRIVAQFVGVWKQWNVAWIQRKLGVPLTISWLTSAGTITEAEFLSFFCRQTRTSLSALLKSYVLDHTYIVATTFGRIESHILFFGLSFATWPATFSQLSAVKHVPMTPIHPRKESNPLTPPGMGKNNEHIFNKEIVASQNVKPWLRNVFNANQINCRDTIWLDMVGYDAATFRDLATELEIDEDILAKALLFR